MDRPLGETNPTYVTMAEVPFLHLPPRSSSNRAQARPLKLAPDGGAPQPCHASGPAVKLWQELLTPPGETPSPAELLRMIALSPPRATFTGTGPRLTTTVPVPPIGA